MKIIMVSFLINLISFAAMANDSGQEVYNIQHFTSRECGYHNSKMPILCGRSKGSITKELDHKIITKDGGVIRIIVKDGQISAYGKAPGQAVERKIRSMNLDQIRNRIEQTEEKNSNEKSRASNFMGGVVKVATGVVGVDAAQKLLKYQKPAKNIVKLGGAAGGFFLASSLYIPGKKRATDYLLRTILYEGRDGVAVEITEKPIRSKLKKPSSNLSHVNEKTFDYKYGEVEYFPISKVDNDYFYIRDLLDVGLMDNLFKEVVREGQNDFKDIARTSLQFGEESIEYLKSIFSSTREPGEKVDTTQSTRRVSLSVEGK